MTILAASDADAPAKTLSASAVTSPDSSMIHVPPFTSVTDSEPARPAGKKEKKKQELAALAAVEGGANGINKEGSQTVEAELPKTDSVDGVREPTLDAKRPTLATDELVCG